GVVGLEGIDGKLVEFMRKKGLHAENAEMLPKGGGWLIAEFGGDSPQAAEDAARHACERLRRHPNAPAMAVYADKRQQARVWEVREAALGATANVPGQPLTWPGWEDASVAPERLGAYLREFRALLDRFGYDCSLYGHFGDGCVHCRIDFDLFGAQGVDRYKAFTKAAADLVVSHGGSLSGEHGDGQSRGPLLERMFGGRLVAAFRDFKAIWDPAGLMNPGKLVDSQPQDANLRLGPDFQPRERETAFAFAADRGSFVRASLRCVGVGTCRRTEGEGVMCPSFMATLEEKHSTRGRARLLFEMIHGGAIDDGWRSDEVHDALDLCLACKGCKKDCPVNVDMATYKAEFHSHYYKGRPRPREAYGMGLIAWWARAAALMPTVANFALSAPGLSRAAKWAGGIAPQRSMPRFARQTFSRGFRRRGPKGGGPRVVLFPDTFTDHFDPHILWAAAEVLERAGLRVDIPRRRVCCGRPLYAWGMLDLARRQLGGLLDALADDIRQDVPLVVLEPACLSTLKDELQELFPKDERARRLGQLAQSLPDFLDKREGWRAPRLRGSALFHPHCHQRAVLGLEGERRVMAAMGLDCRVPETGCCGMAGSFGFEEKHYSVSMACAERVLLPAVREAGLGTFVIADGFSCREQIRQATAHHPMHVAEVLRLASGR
ncbi:MAG: 4Fe-4S dicluster domain-containing protein, partial [Alphaproteobacteria bacterium]|nr:4Fe-4S dicluster domain-containing protein [Alphaproteobacteria bacterium]